LADVVFIDEETDAEMAGTRVAPHDVLLNITGASLGRCALAPEGIERANVNQHVCIIRPRATMDSRFLHASICSSYVQTQIFSSENGTSREGLNFQQVGGLRIPLPPLPEQRAIAAFLDRETAKIDALVAKKRRLIELLQEKRAALISRAVTKGLNPDVPMKNSGIEWLGEVPEHWETRELRYALEFLNHRRIPISGEDRAVMEKKYPYYGASGIIDAVDNYIFDEPLILIAEDGANLLSRSTPLAFVAQGKYWVNNHAHILRPKHGPIRYWEGLLRTIEYQPWVTGSAQPKLTKENLGSVKLPIPPVEEQVAIAGRIERDQGLLDPINETLNKAIDHLLEYRTALISAAVTGKIDVRIA
jgi:type I restriction enzyme S subunit